jgi:hypothetical protein
MLDQTGRRMNVDGRVRFDSAVGILRLLQLWGMNKIADCDGLLDRGYVVGIGLNCNPQAHTEASQVVPKISHSTEHSVG